MTLEATKIPNGYYTKAQLQMLMNAWEGCRGMNVPTKKNALIISTPVSKWDINGFRVIRCTVSDRNATYGGKLYQVEYLW